MMEQHQYNLKSINKTSNNSNQNKHIVLLKFKKRSKNIYSQQQFQSNQFLTQHMAIKFTSNQKNQIKFTSETQADPQKQQQLMVQQFGMFNINKQSQHDYYNTDSNIPAFLLEKVDPTKYFNKTDKIQNNNEESKKNQQLQFAIKSHQNFNNHLKSIRNQKINESRQKFKIIDVIQEQNIDDIKDKNVRKNKKKKNQVDFKGIKYYYQNLKENDINQEYDYYLIIRNTFESQIDYHPIKTLYIDKQYERMLQDTNQNEQQFQIQQQMQAEQDKQDSNRQDRSDYDYPQQSQSEKSNKSKNSAYDDSQQQNENGYNSDSSNEIISGNRSKYNKSNKNKNKLNEDQYDSEKLYKQYLQRCKNYKQDEQDFQMHQCL